MTHAAAREETESPAAREGTEALAVGPDSQHNVRRRVLELTGLVLLVMVSAGLAYAIGATSQSIYAARTELVYVGATGNNSLDDQAIGTQTALLTGRPVLAAVAEAEDIDIEELTAAVSAERVDGSQLIELTVEDPDPVQAGQIANAIVDAYLSTTTGTVTDPLEADFLNTRLGELQAQLSAAQAQGQSPVGQQLISQQILDIQSRLTDLQLENLDSAPPVRIVSPAYALSDPVGPHPLRSAAAGGLVGFLLAAGILVVSVSRRRAAGARE